MDKMRPCAAYAMVAEAIRFVRAHAREQPGLAEIAAHVGLSPAHVQRVFQDWAGISPKRFLQYLTKESARKLLRDSHDALFTSLEAGLSGPGRLHDLMVAAEAMTPGEIKARGQGLTIVHGVAATPLGFAAVARTERGVCRLRFLGSGDDAAETQALRAEWPKAALVQDDATAQAAADAVFQPGGPTLPALLRGTNFQIKVWEALLRVPFGHAVSYSGLAAMIGAPKARRAVGSALAANSLAFLIPCHRVLRENGDTGRYRWGDERKAALLVWERAACP